MLKKLLQQKKWKRSERKLEQIFNHRHNFPAVRIRKRYIILALSTSVVAFVMYVLWLLSAPSAFPIYAAVDIEEGMTTPDIVRMLHERHVVRSPRLLHLVLSSVHQNDFIQAGAYLFDRPLSVLEVARAITNGEYLSPPLRITIPEGLHGAQIAHIVAEKLPEEAHKDISAELFDEHIGYLFPDTYHVPESFTTEELINLMRRTFDEKIAPLEVQIAESPFNEKEIITLASIVVREANTEQEMRTVAGILMNRLAIGMPLQVDASFYFLLGKTSAEVTQEDLAIDSPYNTYRYAGLPPTPIANPGLDAINAVLNPIPTDFLFYLTAADGTFYYSETFEQHRNYKFIYLP